MDVRIIQSGSLMDCTHKKTEAIFQYTHKSPAGLTLTSQSDTLVHATLMDQRYHR